MQESSFTALLSEDVDPSKHFPVDTLFDSIKYRKATAQLSDEQLTLIDSLAAKFKEYLLPCVTFETEDKAKVAIVFERINRAGTELKIMELLSAWTWSETFNLPEKFDDLKDILREHDYEGLCDNSDLLLKKFSGVISHQTTPNAIINLKGDEVRDRFEEI
ncbi:MAG: hypothetical protein ACJARD_001606 [Alphaproteobacteria bacterium]|jgi:hypothetical protein